MKVCVLCILHRCGGSFCPKFIWYVNTYDIYVYTYTFLHIWIEHLLYALSICDVFKYT